jgi:alpha-galactosidase
MGVNTLAFRNAQNGAFFMADADCVGIMGERISWKQNREWLNLLAKSGSPLFVSCDPYKVTDEMKKDLKEAFLVNSVQTNKCIPIDIDENLLPSKYDIDGETVSFDWNIE